MQLLIWTLVQLVVIAVMTVIDVKLVMVGIGYISN